MVFWRSLMMVGSLYKYYIRNSSLSQMYSGNCLSPVTILTAFIITFYINSNSLDWIQGLLNRHRTMKVLLTWVAPKATNPFVGQKVRALGQWGFHYLQVKPTNKAFSIDLKCCNHWVNLVWELSSNKQYFLIFSSEITTCCKVVEWANCLLPTWWDNRSNFVINAFTAKEFLQFWIDFVHVTCNITVKCKIRYQVSIT
jgi:hypothetical protein